MAFLKKQKNEGRTEPRESIGQALRTAAGRHSSRAGAFSAGLCALAVAAVVIFNLAIGQLPDTATQFDMTDSQIYNITDTSVNYLKDMSQDVEIHVLANKDSVDSRIVRFLDRYVSLSDHLSLEYTDPDVYPSVLSKYGVEANTIVVTCAATGRQENVSIGDIIGYDQMAYLYYQQYKETTFDAEGLLTSAVDGVLSETAHKVYTTTGHGEGDLPSSIQELFKKAHMTVSSVNLLSGGGIPSDCELLILNAPSKDLANDELAAVESYLAKGGQVIYTMASKLDKLTNFNKLCADYGMSVADGMIMDTQRCYQDKYFLFFPVADTSVDVASGLTEDAGILMYASRGMTLSTPVRDTIETKAFLSTSKDGYSVTDESTRTAGTYVVGALATEKIDDSITARLTVLGSDSLTNTDITQSFTNLDNPTLFMKCATAGFQDVSSVVIPAVNLSDPVNTVTTGWLWAILFILVLPAAALIAGFVRWMRRRRL